MSTLYKRATPAQVVLLRAIAGAVRNAHHAHPHWQLDRSAPRSIAKRAVGTLSAMMPSVLAPFGSSCCSDHVGHYGRGKSAVTLQTADRGRSQLRGPSPLSTLHRDVGKLISAARKDGRNEAMESLVIVARLIGKMRGQA